MAKFLDDNGLSRFFNGLKALFATIDDLDDVNDKLYPTIAGVSINETTGAMELWSQNLNNITATGFYNAMTCTNAYYQYSTLIVIGYYLSGYCLQIQQDVTTGNIATRSQINGTWSAWRTVDIARVQTQSNWNESDTTSEAFIQNKPTIPSKTSDLTNDSNFITLADVPEEIFVAEYGVTAFADVLAAYNAGKALFAMRSSKLYYLGGYDGRFTFYNTSLANSAYLTVDSSSNWTQNSVGLQRAINISGVLQGDGIGGVSAKAVDTTPTSGSSNLITSGAVYSAIIGAIEGSY